MNYIQHIDVELYDVKDIVFLNYSNMLPDYLECGGISNLIK